MSVGGKGAGGKGWSWSFVPTSLLSSEAFLDLDMGDRGLLLSLYLACDRWGRGPGSARSIALAVGSLDVRDIEERMRRLAAAGLVLWDPPHAWELVGHDEQAPAEVTRRRPPSLFPSPSRLDDIQEPSRSHPDGIQTASKSDPDGTHAGTGSHPDGTQEPSRRHPGAIQAASKSDPISIQEPSKSDPDGTWTSLGLEEKRREERREGARAGARTHARVAHTMPAKTEKPAGVFPSAAAEKAAEAWVEALREHGHQTSMHATVTRAALASVAKNHAETFVAACESAIAQGASWGGWRAKYPLRWLAKEAEIVSRRKAPRPAPHPDSDAAEETGDFHALADRYARAARILEQEGRAAEAAAARAKERAFLARAEQGGVAG
jgi:hypothetical protein